MAIYKIFPEQDTTLYSEVPSANTGLDEILEIGSYPSQQVGRAIRSLIKFPSDTLTEVIESNTPTLNFSASIKLYLAEANELPAGYTIEAAPIYSSWVNGVGKFGDIPTNTDGASWNTTDGTGSWNNGLLALNVTASYASGSSSGGGDWYTGSFGLSLLTLQSHGLDSTHDININVTDAVKLHYSQSKGYSGIVNNGFILKLSSSLEFETVRNVRLRYYGKDTHTIYPPSLEIKWDDTVYNTGSSTSSTLSDTNAIFTIVNNRGTYTDQGKYRFRLHTRPKYPVRTFATSSNYLVNYYLPETSYWGIKDANTEEMVYDFDSIYTKISADSTSNYFDIYMEGLQPERYYNVLIKTVLDGSTVVLGPNVAFKVVRNG
jgi:hypothetical protein